MSCVSWMHSDAARSALQGECKSRRGTTADGDDGSTCCFALLFPRSSPPIYIYTILYFFHTVCTRLRTLISELWQMRSSPRVETREQPRLASLCDGDAPMFRSRSISVSLSVVEWLIPKPPTCGQKCIQFQKYITQTETAKIDMNISIFLGGGSW